MVAAGKVNWNGAVLAVVVVAVVVVVGDADVDTTGANVGFGTGAGAGTETGAGAGTGTELIWSPLLFSGAFFSNKRSKSCRANASYRSIVSCKQLTISEWDCFTRAANHGVC